MRNRLQLFLWVAVVAVLAGGLFWFVWHSEKLNSVPGAAGNTVPKSEYGGSASCKECHEEAYELWRKSHHGLAERLPGPEMDGPAFEPARSFKHGSQSSSVSATNGDFFVTARGLSGEPEAHRVARVIGHDPLRQFLVPFPGGRWQTLEAAFDPRATNASDWFNVFGNEDRQPGEWGHWTGRGMNWNAMCATCHNTRLHKNYDAATDSYRTDMAEMTVGCEACHGPARAHNDWQKQFGKSGKKDPTLAKFTRPQVMDTCATCHARRAELTGDFKPGDSFLDHHELTIVDHTDIYYPDGQIRDEDYEYASFRSSKMATNHVTCLDCHNPHSMKTTLPGNWLCMRCHDGSYANAVKINPVEHSHHKVFGYGDDGKPKEVDLAKYIPSQIAETGGECVNCHMPQTLYMQRHWRHDHGFTIPDPLLTKKYNIPNACNKCHQDKTTDWSLAAVEKWYGKRMERSTRPRAETIARARAGDTAAREPLLALLANENPYWQAVAAGLLGQWVGEPAVAAALAKALDHADPLVRGNAVRSLEPLLAQTDGNVAARFNQLLADPSRNVRVAAAWALRATLDTNSPAGRELKRYLDHNADQPSGQLQQGVFHFARNELPAALEHLQKAVNWDSNSVPFRHELAVALSAAGRNPEAIAQLETACRLAPNEAEYRYKLGLAWNEAGDTAKTIAALEEAVQLDPRHVRAWYNLGLARNAAGQGDAAVEALIRAESAAPEDPRIPYARATILLRAGRMEEARAAAQRALELNPADANALRLLQQLSRQQ